MKSTKGTIIPLFLIFSSLYSLAQVDIGTPSEWVMEHKKEIKNTPYIIEGTVIQQKHFKAPNNELMTCYIISITKIYKGSPQIKLGTIKVILSDGAYESNGIIVPTSDGGGVTLGGKGSICIIFGTPTAFKPTDTSMVHSMVAENSITLGWAADPINIDKTSAQWDYTIYNSLDSLYSFFKENGLTVQEEVDETKQK
jgi:hypothetical protein